MLFTKLTKAQYDALSDDLKSHYKQGSSADEYIIDLSGDTPREASLIQQQAQLSRDLLTARSELAIAKQNEDQIEAKYKNEYEGKVNTLTEQVAKLEGTQAANRQTALIDGIASKFTHPELFRSALRDNIKVEYKDGKMVDTIVDNEGKATTLEALTDLYCKDAKYSAMLVTEKSNPTFNSNPASGGQQGTGNAPRQTPAAAGKPTYEQCVVNDATGKARVVDAANMTPEYWSRYAEESVPAENN